MSDTCLLYPPITPYETGFLPVGNGHEIYWEQSGNPDGMPVVFLHGGPGSGTSPWQRQFFDPKKYRIILFDQRGAGKSKPHAELAHNTTAHLIHDMEELRRVFKIDRWHIAGGSWGSTLGLAYADTHPETILSLTLYGIFLCRDFELRDVYTPGGIVSRVFPDVFEPYINLLPDNMQQTPLQGYRDLFQNDNPDIRACAIDMWTRLEKRVSALTVSAEQLNTDMADPDYVIAHSKIENHYFLNNGFVDGDELLQRLPQKLQNIPIHLVQGRYDMVCPFITAWQVHAALPDSRLHIIENAGHTARAPDMTRALVQIFDQLV